MSTSANVVEYRIEKDGKTVGNYRQNLMCMSRFEEMLKWQPLEDHTVTPYGYDEEEDYWEGDTQNLKEYLQKHIRSNKAIKEFFDNDAKEDVSKNRNRGCCDECGEGYDNEEDWLYNTECELCGCPIPEHLIVRRQ